MARNVSWTEGGPMSELRRSGAGGALEKVRGLQNATNGHSLGGKSLNGSGGGGGGATFVFMVRILFVLFIAHWASLNSLHN